MGKKDGKMAKDVDGNKKDNEGHSLLGSPRFKDIGNGRFRCVETGHELPAHSKDSYSLTKHCRLGLINSALSKNKPPLNMFRQDPQCSSKLICKLTGDIINKNEQHIWKHINGKHFLNVLEQKEVEQEAPKELVEKKNDKGEKKGKRNGKRNNKAEAEEDLEELVEKKNDKGEQKGNRNGKRNNKAEAEEDLEELVEKKNDKQKGNRNGKKNNKAEAEEDSDKRIKKQKEDVEKDSSDPDEDIDFWMPPAGERWDNDDGGDRWGSDTEDDDDDEKEGDPNVDNHECAVEKRKECVLQETQGSSFVSRKKMKTKATTEGCVKGTSSGLQSSTTSS